MEKYIYNIFALNFYLLSAILENIEERQATSILLVSDLSHDY